jgi:hypothetical protein
MNIGIWQHAGQQMIGIAVNRALSDFTERERSCLAVLRSHVIQDPMMMSRESSA